MILRPSLCSLSDPDVNVFMVSWAFSKMKLILGPFYTHTTIWPSISYLNDWLCITHTNWSFVHTKNVTQEVPKSHFLAKCLLHSEWMCMHNTRCVNTTSSSWVGVTSLFVFTLKLQTTRGWFVHKTTLYYINALLFARCIRNVKKCSESDFSVC